MSGEPSVTASGIKKGQSLRVILEGEVEHAWSGYFCLARGGERNIIRPDSEHVVSVEVLPDPEPKWQPRDVVLDGSGRIFVRLDDDSPQWRHLYQGASSGVPSIEGGQYLLIRPLTLLVRDGKPVTS